MKNLSSATAGIFALFWACTLAVLFVSLAMFDIKNSSNHHLVAVAGAAFEVVAVVGCNRSVKIGSATPEHHSEMCLRISAFCVLGAVGGIALLADLIVGPLRMELYH